MRYASSPSPRPGGSASKPLASLILKRADASRSSGQRKDDDYDVIADGNGRPHIQVDRLAAGKSMDVDARPNPDRYEATCEAAIATFIRSWGREWSRMSLP
jgi:hypothetical protein